MSTPEVFQAEVQANISALGQDAHLRDLTREWMTRISRHRYAHNFTWLGLPIIQCPQDVVALQEIVWRTRPDLIVETGIARGGSLIFYASLLELLGNDGRVVGVDIDVRSHNRSAIERHPLARRITLIQGSSVSPAVCGQVVALAQGRRRVLVVLDSNHTHDHVFQELQLYSPLVTKGSYLVVLDTGIEDMPEDLFTDRPWGKGNNPKTAVQEFLRHNDRFRVNDSMDAKLVISVAPGGYLECVKD